MPRRFAKTRTPITVYLTMVCLWGGFEVQAQSPPAVSNALDPDCCMGRVGNANGLGGDEPTIGDVSVMINAKFITGRCDGIIACLAEADVNRSGCSSPTCDDVTISDISILIDYLFITGKSLSLQNCEVEIPSFEASQQHFPLMGTYQLALADLDDDDDLDVIFSNMNAQSLVLLNNGNGYFQNSGQSLPWGLHGIATGDIDLDDDLDLFFSPNQASSPSTPIYINNGLGSFQQFAPGISYGDMTGLGVTLADIDNDADLDALIQRSREFVRLNNDGTGRFSPSGVTYPDMSVFCDLNSDGYVDIFAREVGVGFRVYLNDGTGEFSEHGFLAKSNVLRSGTFFADVDNDGDPDAIYTNGEGTTYPSGILLNDGDGGFTESGQVLPSVSMSRVGTGDLNGDGWIDLVFTDWNTLACQVWLNEGCGQFFDSGIRLGGVGGWGNCVVADVDNDGDNDIFVAGYYNVSNVLWFNQNIAPSPSGRR